MTKRLVVSNSQPVEGAERLVWEFFGMVAFLLALAGIVIVLWR